MKLVFCGTPAFAVPTLKAVLAAGHEVALAVTQPDRPSGRGMQMVEPPVKVTAREAGIEVVQPEKIKNNLEFRAHLDAIRPDVIVVVAYGRIIPKWMLDLPRHGNLNLHASLLPKYRGAAPIQWAVAMGETVTGVTTMLLAEGLDTGDMLLQKEMGIGPDMTAQELFPLLAEMGAPLMVETLAELEAGTIVPRKQDDSQATLAPILTREDGRMDFARSASEIYNRWRGFYPWPGAWTVLGGKKLTVHAMGPVEGSAAAEPGTVHVGGGRLVVACGGGTAVEIVELQLEGKKRMVACDFLRGHALAAGTRLGD
ncbi:MAG: methionyl-tRNA formyltransferase [Acidobacteriaceae bacterium]